MKSVKKYVSVDELPKVYNEKFCKDWRSNKRHKVEYQIKKTFTKKLEKLLETIIEWGITLYDLMEHIKTETDTMDDEESEEETRTYHLYNSMNHSYGNCLLW